MSIEPNRFDEEFSKYLNLLEQRIRSLENETTRPSAVETTNRILITAGGSSSGGNTEEGTGAVEWQEPVEDKDVSDPTTLTPSEGDRYIVASGGSGDWNGKDDDIAEYDGSSWLFTTPTEGYAVYIKDENKVYIYTTSWVTLDSLISHDNITGVSASDHHTKYGTSDLESDLQSYSSYMQFSTTQDQLRFTDGDNIFWMRKDSNNYAFAVYNSTTASWLMSLTDAGVLANISKLTVDNIVIDGDTIAYSSDSLKIDFNGKFIQYKESVGGSFRYGIDMGNLETDVVSIRNRHSSGVVKIYANTSTAGGAGEIQVLDLSAAGASDPRVAIPSVNSTTGTNCVITSGDEIFKDSTSSKRFKKNIRPLEIKTEDLYKLDLISFEFNDKTLEPNKTWFGITAEQCLQYFPEIVAMDKEGLPENIMHQYLPYLMLDLIQKQKTKIDDLETRLEVLESAS